MNFKSDTHSFSQSMRTTKKQDAYTKVLENAAT